MSFFQILSIIILARILTPIVFGQLAAASVLIGLAAAFAEIGVSSAIVQKKNITPGFITTAFIITSMLFLILATLIYFFAPYIASYNKDDSLISVIRFLCISFFLNGISSIPKGLLLRELQYKKLLYCSVIPFITSINIVSVSLAFYGFGIWSIVYGQTLNSLLVFLGSTFFANSRLTISLDFGHIKHLLYFGGGITLSRLFNYLSVAGDRLVLGNTMNLEFLGIFERLYKISSLISSQLGSIFDNIIFPLFSKEQDNHKLLAAMYYKAIEAASIIGLLIGLIAPLFSYELTFLILGSQYLEYHYVLQILLILSFTRLLTRAGDAILRSQAMVYESAIVKLCSAIIAIGGIYITSQYGLYLIPFAYLLSSLFTSIVLHVLISRRINSSLKKALLIIVKNILSISLILLPIWAVVYIFTNLVGSIEILLLKVFLLCIVGYIIYYYPKILGASFDELLNKIKNKFLKIT